MAIRSSWKWAHQAAVAWLGLVLATGLSTGAETQDILTKSGSVPRPSALEKYVSRKVVEVISLSHYAKHPVDQDYSGQWFNEYFRQLDPSKMFFLQSDIEDFRSYEKVLGDLVMRRGNIDFAFDVYARYLQRVQEWAAYATARLAQPIDLATKETIQIDRRDAAWPSNLAELEDLWRRQLMNRVLMEQLADEGETAGGDGDRPGGILGDPPDAELNEVGDTRKGDVGKPRKPPVERAGESYLRFLKRKTEAEAIEIVETFLNSLTHLYDPHSAYLAPDSEDDFDISMKLSLQGIGAVLTTKDSYVEVVEIVPGGPAARDGRLKAGDRIVAVAQGEDLQNPVDVVDMPLRKVVRLIRGTSGTRVLLSVLASGSNMPTAIDIVRDKVELKEQQAKCEMKGVVVPSHGTAGPTAHVAVIVLPNFYLDFEGRREGNDDYASCTRDVQRLIEGAAKGSMDGLILDLRGNGGGALDEAVRLAGFFFGKGPVVQVRDSRGTVKKREATDAEVLYGGPMVVLVDKLSASASEIVAAALQDHGRAVIMGESSTHGKGTVQTVYSLDKQLSQTSIFEGQRGGSVKFTIQKFYRVNGGSTQVRGVVPDLQFASFTDYMELGEASMPHALAWDEIAPLEASRVIDVTPWLPELKRRFVARLQASAEYASLRADIEHYAERRKLKELPLNLEERRAFQKDEEQWAKKMRDQSRKRKTPSTVDKPDEMAAVPDPLLDQAVLVMGDMIALQRGELTVSTPSVPPPAPAGTPGVVVKSADKE